MIVEMDYQTYPPCDALAPFIKCFWSLEAPALKEPESQHIVPDGCMEMIFHYGDLYRQFLPNGNAIIQPRSFVFGQVTSSLKIIPTGATGIIAARFHPNGFVVFSKCATHLMENRAVSLADLFGEAGTQLEKNVMAASTMENRMKEIELFLVGKLKTAPTDEIAKSSVDVLLRLKGQLSVDDLAIQLRTNRRKLERRFSSIIGLSPKQLAKIIRLQCALKMLEQNKNYTLTELALENGYFDQAHFIKDFKEFTGLSPKQFYANSMKLTSLFLGAD
jgi:AraC-like DNA-binding protein